MSLMSWFSVHLVTVRVAMAVACGGTPGGLYHRPWLHRSVWRLACALCADVGVRRLLVGLRLHVLLHGRLNFCEHQFRGPALCGGVDFSTRPRNCAAVGLGLHFLGVGVVHGMSRLCMCASTRPGARWCLAILAVLATAAYAFARHLSAMVFAAPAVCIGLLAI